MNKWLCFILFALPVCAQQSYESFIVSVQEEKVSVTTPSKNKKGVITVIVQNKTFERIISEIRSDKKVLKRFTLEPEGAKGANFSLTVDFSKLNSLYYVSVSPPFQAVPLDPSGKNYEIP